MKTRRQRRSDPIRLPDWVDGLQSQGRYTYTRDEALGETALTPIAFAAAARRLTKSGRLAMPRRGFYVIVPLEHRATGAPPATWFIHDLMTHLHRPYYVGLLTAAALHGAAHQAPQVFQVITDLPTRPVEIGRVRIEFIQGRPDTPVVQLNTPTGTMRVSSPEGTALDLVRHVDRCGGLSHVATVLKELVDAMDAASLVAAARRVEMTVVQRLGFLLDLVGANVLADRLAARVAKGPSFPVALRPDLAAEGAERSDRWRLAINDRVELDE